MSSLPGLRAHLKAFLIGIVLAAVGLTAYSLWSRTDQPSRALAELPPVTVYKSPTCGCCAAWVDHMEENGFAVTVEDVTDLDPVKERLGVPDRLSSCHTATVGGFVVEGHVPADDVKLLLAEQPDVRGLAVPGMPIGSPGMEVEGRAAEPYAVVAFDHDGAAEIFARH